VACLVERMIRNFGGKRLSEAIFLDVAKPSITFEWMVSFSRSPP
jgi:hypothetical protein